eukprot:1859-Heterococcus_DN1.PRE.2
MPCVLRAVYMCSVHVDAAVTVQYACCKCLRHCMLACAATTLWHLPGAVGVTCSSVTSAAPLDCCICIDSMCKYSGGIGA